MLDIRCTPKFVISFAYWREKAQLITRITPEIKSIHIHSAIDKNTLLSTYNTLMNITKIMFKILQLLLLHSICVNLHIK